MASKHDELSSDVLIQVQKPARYLGREVNSVRKDLVRVGLRMALAFPDMYEVGQSHLGLKILYAIVNGHPELFAERVFAPWPDMEETMRRASEPLRTLETGTPLSEMDFVGFSLQYELTATTVLLMLDLGGIPLRAVDRTDRDPFVVGGGPTAFNPVPVAPFFDAFAIGDGEDLILELAETHLRWKKSKGTRQELLAAWKQIPGVYVPSLHQAGETVHRRILADLEAAPFPNRPVVPFCEIVHDRVGLEIARGCTRGCRFCQAGMLYRPVRERSPQRILEIAQESIAATGWEEIALLSLSTGDYSRIGHLIQHAANRFTGDRVALSLPSLRTDTFSEEMAAQIRKVRKTGFTLAPEAGTDRLRRIINKGNTEEDLERAVSAAFAQGWQSVKLYFMIGLPFETDEDLDGIADLILKVSRWSRGGKITASISTFVPKCHTPFQWVEQIPMEEIRRRQDYIKSRLKRRSVQVKCHDERVSFLEGVIARGDARLSEVIELAYRNGARLDSWDDHLRFHVWMDAFQQAGVDPSEYLRARPLDWSLPWGFIDTGVRPEFLVDEWEKAVGEESTPDCRQGECVGCGVCDFDTVRPILAGNSIPDSVAAAAPVSGEQGKIRRFRLKYARGAAMRFLGHQDVIRVFYRAFRRAGIGLDYSKGFHPHPKLRFSPPLALGVESKAEYLDFDTIAYARNCGELMDALATELPEGITPLALDEISLNEGPISARTLEFRYEIALGGIAMEEAERHVAAFRSADAVEVTLGGAKKNRVRDVKEFVRDVTLDGGRLVITILSGQSGSVNPLDAFAAVLGLGREEIRSLGVVKTAVQVASNGMDEKPFHEHREMSPR